MRTNDASHLAPGVDKARRANSSKAESTQQLPKSDILCPGPVPEDARIALGSQEAAKEHASSGHVVAQLAMAIEVGAKKAIQNNFKVPPTAAQMKKAWSLAGKRILPRGKPGRPRSKAVTRATDLRRKGHSWREIYPQVIENYAQLSEDSRKAKTYQLRQAVYQRDSSDQKTKFPGIDFFADEMNIESCD